jgi:hypothetical protein
MSEKATSQKAGDGWGDNAGEANTDNNGDGNESKNMLEERMSEGTGLISNEFQVEVSCGNTGIVPGADTIRSNLPISRPTPIPLCTLSKTLTNSQCE